MGFERIACRTGDWRLELAPAHGGAITGLRFGDRDVLRPTPDDATDPLAFASFPLVPFANRIADGEMTVNGRAVSLAHDPVDPRHALHGTGWRRAWTVAEHDEQGALLVLDHAGDDGWPWPFRAEQRFVLGDAGLTVTLAATNRAAETLPFGIGFHPYFQRDDRSRLRFAAEGVWLQDDRSLPTEPAPVDRFGDFAAGAPLERDGLLDHCFFGWTGSAAITQDDLAITLDSSPELGWLHVYAPPEYPLFCVEPVSHMPDAVNRAEPADRTGLRLLAPGEMVAGSMRIGAARR